MLPTPCIESKFGHDARLAPPFEFDMTPTTLLTGLCFGEGPRRHDGSRTLFILTASSSDPDAYLCNRDGRIHTVTAPHAGAGLP